MAGTTSAWSLRRRRGRYDRGGGAVEIQWQTWFDIGHERIDAEHRAFLNLIRSLGQDYSNGASRDKICRTVEELLKYADFHFFSEENIMIDCAYPELKNHTKMHSVLMEDMRTYVDEVRRGRDCGEEMVTFLYNWFCTHTVSEDSRIAAYVAESAGQGGQAPHDKSRPE
jgi:hemerythrin